MSPPEVLLWNQVRARKLGFKVRRQHPIGPYVADFFVCDANLVIEIDGEAHDFGLRPLRDAARDRYIEDHGYRVMRLTAVDVMNDLEAVVRMISERVANPLHHLSDGPPPRPGEEL